MSPNVPGASAPMDLLFFCSTQSARETLCAWLNFNFLNFEWSAMQRERGGSFWINLIVPAVPELYWKAVGFRIYGAGWRARARRALFFSDWVINDILKRHKCILNVVFCMLYSVCCILKHKSGILKVRHSESLYSETLSNSRLGILNLLAF